MNHTTNPRLRVLLCILCALLTLAWLAFIFGNSLRDGEESGEQSGKVHQIVNDIAQSIGIEEPISEKTIRNTAHFTEFAILSILLCLDGWVFRLLRFSKKPRESCAFALLAIPACFLLACVDELLQTTSPGRAAQFSDILLDTAGATCGTVCFLLFFFALRAIFGRKAKKEAAVS